MSGEKTTVIDDGFKGEILCKLNELRKEGILCDVTLRIEGQDFKAHRCVLSAASPYFRALFTCEFKLIENEKNLIDLQDMKSTAAKEVLDFIYTGQAMVDSANAQDLLRAADYLIIPSLKTQVAQFLENTIDAANCLVLEAFGAQFNCRSLEQAAITYKLQNFVAVVKSESFKALGFEKVKDLLCNDEIIVSKEEEVYEAVIAWVKHDLLAREHLLPELLKCVRLFSMSKYSLRDILETEELIIKNSTCANTLHKGMDFFLFPDHFECMLLKPRSCLTKYEHAVILTGGHGKHGLCSKQTHCFSLTTNKWMKLSTMPFSRTRHGAAVCSGQFYVLGGEPSSPICCFNFKQNKWSCVSKRKFAFRHHFSVTTYQEEVYVTGGENYWCSVVKFDPKHDEWTNLKDMSTCRAAHCAVALVNGLCVLSGADDDFVCQKSVEFYDPLTDQWNGMPDMLNARSLAAAATISGGKILVVGGYRDMEFKVVEASCEIFDPVVNQWSLLANPLVPRAACGIVSFDNHVYLFGGEDYNQDRESIYHDSMECYSIQNNTWQLLGVIPERISFLQAALVLLPKKLFEDDGIESCHDPDDIDFEVFDSDSNDV